MEYTRKTVKDEMEKNNEDNEAGKPRKKKDE